MAEGHLLASYKPTPFLPYAELCGTLEAPGLPGLFPITVVFHSGSVLHSLEVRSAYIYCLDVLGYLSSCSE